MTATRAVSRALDRFEARLAAVDDEYLSERASDVGEVKRRLLDALTRTRSSLRCADGERCRRGEKRVVVAEHLTASLVVELSNRGVVGLVTDRGGQNCHGAILARSVGLPAVSGVHQVVQRLGCGAELCVDGDEGVVTLWPSRDAVAANGGARARRHRPERSDPVATVRVMANINWAREATDAVAAGAEGIGLYRTETECLAAQRPLTEDEQFERYRRVIDAVPGGPVYFRLLDLGGDKHWANLLPEDNPQLGLRGTRLLLARPDLLEPQARALARASETTGKQVHVMYPMVTGVEQFLRARATFLRATADFPRAEFRHGVMLEVPAACLQARELLDLADFASVGTNDLIQFLYAVDRDNDAVAQDYSAEGPVVWSLLAHVADAAHATGRPLSICGEIGGDPAYLERLLASGVRTVSTSMGRIASIRARAIELDEQAASGRHDADRRQPSVL